MRPLTVLLIAVMLLALFVPAAAAQSRVGTHGSYGYGYGYGYGHSYYGSYYGSYYPSYYYTYAYPSYYPSYGHCDSGDATTKALADLLLRKELAGLLKDDKKPDAPAAGREAKRAALRRLADELLREDRAAGGGARDEPPLTPEEWERVKAAIETARK